MYFKVELQQSRSSLIIHQQITAKQRKPLKGIACVEDTLNPLHRAGLYKWFGQMRGPAATRAIKGRAYPV